MTDRIYRFLSAEWLFVISVICLLATSWYRHQFPSYSIQDMTPLFLLTTLFIAVKGIENSKALLKLSSLLEKGKHLPVKLVLITFLLSIFVTIDVSLVTMIPLVLALHVDQRNYLVILVALTAHAGAAITPFGTPQNLFIFSFYHTPLVEFITTIAPFSIGMLILLTTAALFVKTTAEPKMDTEPVRVETRPAVVYGVLFILIVLCILHIVPLFVATAVVIYALIFDRASLSVDYALIATFFCFLGLAENIKIIISSIFHHADHIFLLSAGLSQFISNVPSTLLLSKFTPQWKALLWGVNVGGFGSIVAALANLITYKLYAANNNRKDTMAFTIKFIAFGYILLFVGVGLYFVLGMFSTRFSR